MLLRGLLLETIGALAKLVNGDLEGAQEIKVSGVADLQSALPGNITFLANKKNIHLLMQTKATAVVVPRSMHDLDIPCIKVDDPNLAIALIHNFFLESPFKAEGIHSSASIGKNCTISSEVTIGACAVLGDRVRVGERVIIHPGVILGDDVAVGDDSEIKANVTVGNNCLVGNRVIIHPGAAIGNDGFGYATTSSGFHIKRPHVGIVQIDDDVEIGANTCVDRATFGRTWLKSGCKIDNLVQIAHNVVIGEGSIIVSQVGIAGSAELGRGVMLGGQTAIADHVQLGDRVMVGAKSGVHNNQAEKTIVSGIPAFPHKLWLRVCAVIPKLPELAKDVRMLKKQVTKLLESKSN